MCFCLGITSRNHIIKAARPYLVFNRFFAGFMLILPQSVDLLPNFPNDVCWRGQRGATRVPACEAVLDSTKGLTRTAPVISFRPVAPAGTDVSLATSNFSVVLILLADGLPG